jgi:flagellar protein FlgJ
MPAVPNSNSPLASVNSSLVKPASFNGLSADTRSLNSLKNQAASDPKAAAREAAKQFESLFMGELVKSMRISTQPTGMLDNAGTQLGTEMLDQQLATQTSGRPGGLSEAILKQLERQMGMAPGPIPATGSANNTPAPLQPQKLPGQPVGTRIPQSGAAGFVQQHMNAAKTVEAASGIPASFMVSQAALETGWGRKEIKHGDGTPSFNLFGIKAGGSWKGPVAEVPTTEFINGKATRVMAKFRAYGSYAESFSDYAQLMSKSPRYQAVLKGVQQTQAANSSAKDSGVNFAQNMQRAGYATDPEYADKLSKVINTTLRLQRSIVA